MDNKPSVYIIPIALVLAGGLIALAVWSQQGSTPMPANVDSIEVGSLPPLGDPNAPVVFVEFGDYQCPFCGRFLEEVESKLRDEYVSSGQMVIYWRDFPFLGDESYKAALAARCANEQGKFWQYHDLLYSRQEGENRGAFSQDNLISFASEIELDTESFRACLVEERYKNEVMQDLTYAQELQIQGTPTSFINGERVAGAQPYEYLKGIIEKYLP